MKVQAMNINFIRIGGVFFLVLSLTFGSVILVSEPVRADSWSDDFTSIPDFHPRWSDGEIGQALPDGESHAWAKSFDPPTDYPITEENLPLWYGPSIRAGIAPSGDFTVSGKFNCVADVADFNVGKLEIQLLDSSYNIVHAMGWADASNSTNAVSLYVRGQSGSIIYMTNPGYSFSIFISKTLSLVRSGDEIAFLIEGSEVFRASASMKAVNYVQVQFLRHKAGDIELMCTPKVMKLDSISVQTTPAKLPGRPENLTCMGLNGYVNLAWAAPLDDGGIPILNYRIFRGTTAGALTLLTSVGNVLSFNDTGLTNGMTYYYAVSAQNEVGEGDSTDEIDITPLSLPGIPANLQAIAGIDHVNLTWDEPALSGGADITGYTVYRGLQPESLSLLTVLGTVFSYSDFDVIIQTKYYYAISATTVVGEGPVSETVEAAPGAPLSAPSEPRNLAVQPLNRSVMISWSAPSSTGNAQITNYTIYRGFNADTVTLHAVLGNAFYYTDMGLSNGQKYYYAVSVRNTVGESPVTKSVGATPIAPSLPSPPYNITLESGDGQIMLRWQMPLDDGHSTITGYIIYRGTSVDNLTMLVSLNNVLTYADTGLASGQEYFYRLSALNSVGEGVDSEILSATTFLPDPGPGNPDNPDNETYEDTTGGWSLNSSFVTVAVLAVTVVIALIYFKKSSK